MGEERASPDGGVDLRAAPAVSTSDGLPPLREVVRAFGIQPRRTLGQNFLFDLNLTRRIARAAGPLDGTVVVEIGPGPGGLTRALLAEGAECVIAIERDPRCTGALVDIAGRYPGRLHVVEADALTLDLADLVRRHAGSAAVGRIVANLPYNVATPLLTRWLETPPWPPWFDRLVLMFQREVADRIVATVAQRRDYGRLGVLCGWRTQARILFDVAPTAFVPPPQVTSAIVELRPRLAPLSCEAAMLSIVTAAAFGQRRKMLRQSLKTLPMRAATDLARILEIAGIDPTARAEEIDVAGFVALANAVTAIHAAPR